ncbi:N-acetylglucosamine kinase [Arboricoccus pini]|uniref:N-acetylglucosamine kinase n=1 Tax=Arboricoccus pini TaxID=1963835 RepID=A0A212RMZ0_9PROT|nr:BadF/BadG/BcrA/BcrD ATPase family protein [Arboricoccus pini]SNB73928.1 N-acetylglucosamine kinase [Arboricoccus pini]
MSEIPLVLGLDSGGSKTLAAVADPAGGIVMLAMAGGTGALDRPDWDDVLAGLLRRCLRPGLVAAALGLSSFGEVEASTARQTALVQDLLPCPALLRHPALLRNDVEIAFHGAFAGGPGILLLAGTGSMVWAGAADGTRIRVGGWGDLFGDEGSAYWIGREALARAAMALDGRQDGRAFASAVLAAIGAEAVDAREGGALLDWAYGLDHRRPAIAALARTVDAEAVKGDLLARDLLAAAADHLAMHVAAARRRLPGGATLPWSLAGGLFDSKTLTDLVVQRIGRDPLPARLPPLGGALLAAARAAGWPIDDGWIERVRASLLQARPT